MSLAEFGLVRPSGKDPQQGQWLEQQHTLSDCALRTGVGWGVHTSVYVILFCVCVWRSGHACASVVSVRSVTGECS